MTTAWAHLPNAQHIDRVLAHLKQHPDRWDAARGAARDAARGAAWGATRDAARDAARGAALGAISTLVAYDEAGDLMNRSPEQLNGLYQLTEHPMYLLLQPFLTIYPGEKQ